MLSCTVHENVLLLLLLLLCLYMSMSMVKSFSVNHAECFLAVAPVSLYQGFSDLLLRGPHLIFFQGKSSRTISDNKITFYQ